MRTLRSLLLSLVLFSGTLCAQEAAAPFPLKGRVFAYWGYNRAMFSASTIHFTGEGLDLRLHKVMAHDRPAPFSAKGYFAPVNIWIPQYNYRIGWFATQRWSLSLGMDHMKYVVDQGQTVRRSGEVGMERSERYAGHVDSEVMLTSDLLMYEHTDGLNLLSVDADHHLPLWTSKNGKHTVQTFQGLFAGVVIPRSDVRLFGEGENNRFHLSGGGVGAQAGIMAIGWQRLMLRTGARGGHIFLPDVLTTGRAGDRARQHFRFLEGFLALGVLLGR